MQSRVMHYQVGVENMLMKVAAAATHLPFF